MGAFAKRRLRPGMVVINLPGHMCGAWVHGVGQLQMEAEDLLLLGAPISSMNNEGGPYVQNFVLVRGLDDKQIADSVDSEWSKLDQYERLKALQVYLFQDALKNKVLTINRFQALRVYAQNRNITEFYEVSDIVIVDSEGTKMSVTAINAVLREVTESSPVQ